VPSPHPTSGEPRTDLRREGSARRIHHGGDALSVEDAVYGIADLVNESSKALNPNPNAL